jgi:hypothetical protein
LNSHRRFVEVKSHVLPLKPINNNLINQPQQPKSFNYQNTTPQKQQPFQNMNQATSTGMKNSSNYPKLASPSTPNIQYYQNQPAVQTRPVNLNQNNSNKISTITVPINKDPQNVYNTVNSKQKYYNMYPQSNLTIYHQNTPATTVTSVPSPNAQKVHNLSYNRNYPGNQPNLNSVTDTRRFSNYDDEYYRQLFEQNPAASQSRRRSSRIGNENNVEELNGIFQKIYNRNRSTTSGVNFNVGNQHGF